MDGTYIVANYDCYILSTSKEYVRSRIKINEHVAEYTFTGDYILHGQGRLMYARGFYIGEIADMYISKNNISDILEDKNNISGVLEDKNIILNAFMRYNGGDYLELTEKQIKIVVDQLKGVHGNISYPLGRTIYYNAQHGANSWLHELNIRGRLNIICKDNAAQIKDPLQN